MSDSDMSNFALPNTDERRNSRSEAARTKNLYPCRGCQKARQRCEGGIPCKRCCQSRKSECVHDTSRKSSATSGEFEFIEENPAERSSIKCKRRGGIQKMSDWNSGSCTSEEFGAPEDHATFNDVFVAEPQTYDSNSPTRDIADFEVDDDAYYSEKNELTNLSFTDDAFPDATLNALVDFIQRVQCNVIDQPASPIGNSTPAEMPTFVEQNVQNSIEHAVNVESAAFIEYSSSYLDSRVTDQAYTPLILPINSQAPYEYNLSQWLVYSQTLPADYSTSIGFVNPKEVMPKPDNHSMGYAPFTGTSSLANALTYPETSCREHVELPTQPIPNENFHPYFA